MAHVMDLERREERVRSMHYKLSDLSLVRVPCKAAQMDRKCPVAGESSRMHNFDWNF